MSLHVDGMSVRYKAMAACDTLVSCIDGELIFIMLYVRVLICVGLVSISQIVFLYSFSVLALTGRGSGSNVSPESAKQATS